ncbi:MAG: SRPBCC domain-containing protein [Schaalia hyovaginalis]|uniref:SRPBCC family protein n=1 Tax=Schaalia hyovaginalis TaxID=29316 RepID=UPI0012B3050A|nr:SRPBCC domain-containing protein [Schaalia hyovaginalis]MCF2711615.1 SRPBCC domain-containing protein [Schaalia hyovaginalis]MCI6410420.1 SRPBCC domain-containing protein [Schaalia hyovaginalis]MCI6556342.1 SRPBCC domain-containing protein [Schaalia hyovaginalis]MCI7512249.1 SRPBCC domain-containing protein [Schaalia hyovaginalis]MDY3664856.1 SRPBCC domain-containing protein [Schaalia hyovaginalis]
MDFFDDDSKQPEEDFDRVEVERALRAPIEDVWAVVAEPGWWMNDGPLDDHEVTRDEDGVYRVLDPDAGEWLVAKADEDPMDLVAFRWYPLASDELPEEYATRVEISLSDEGGEVVVHVEESGLSSVSDDEDVARQAWEDEAGMWEDVLGALERFFEAKAAR